MEVPFLDIKMNFYVDLDFSWVAHDERGDNKHDKCLGNPSTTRVLTISVLGTSWVSVWIIVFNSKKQWGKKLPLF